MVVWAAAVTTVPERRATLLPRTLASLRAAGFTGLRLFVDGCDDGRSWAQEFGLPVTCRGKPRVRTAGAWVASIAELYFRNPWACRFAIFQDDCISSKNLRLYLERTKYPQRGYQNLYSFPSNQSLSKGVGWYLSNQLGRGAVGLVFDREALLALLGDSHLFMRGQDAHRGHKKIDGGIVESMKRVGFSEYCHDPSPLQHTGDVSQSDNLRHPLAPSFRGENFDLLDLLLEKPR